MTAVEWLDGLELQTLTDELKEDIKAEFEIEKIKFAKYHVEQALKAIKDNICLEGLDHDYYSREISKEIDPHSETYEYGGLIRVYEPSIDEAYLLENIK